MNMTIEEKAKAYDKAIERARKINSGEGVAAPPDWTICEVIFPTLKESEDERIRKWLIGYFNQYIIDGMPQVFGNGLNVKDVIAWLEKQGKQKSIDDLTQQEAMDIAVAKCFEQGEQKPEKQKEPMVEKCGDWSDVRYMSILQELRFLKYLVEYEQHINKEDISKDISKNIEWLKSLKHRVKKQ